MEAYIKQDPQRGRIYWMTDGKTEVGVALDYGIRVLHLSCAGMENLYYVQPADLSDGYGTPDGWKLRGGHRMWLAPEGEHSYHPDDDPVAYTPLPDGVVLEQKLDPLQNIVKTLTITFCDGKVRLDHSFRNAGEQTITGASWGVNTLDGYGRMSVGFAGEDGFTPTRAVALWGDTNLHDARVRFTADSLSAQHAPAEDYCKIGIYSRAGKAEFWNKGQHLTLEFAVPPMTQLPDGGCNFEVFMCKEFLEMEVLGEVTVMQPGEAACHTEWLRVEPMEG